MAGDNVGITEKFIEKSYTANDELKMKNIFQKASGILTSFNHHRDKNLDQKRLKFTIFLYTAKPGKIDIPKLYEIARQFLEPFEQSLNISPDLLLEARYNNEAPTSLYVRLDWKEYPHVVPYYQGEWL